MIIIDYILAFILQFLVILGGTILFVRLIKYLVKKHVERKEFKSIIASGIRYIDQMDGFQFEVFLVNLFKELGYKTKGTKSTRDFGADLFLEGKNKVVIQAKRYGVNNRVGIKAIMEVYFAKKYYDANEAWVITNSLYTSSAKEGAAKSGIRLLDRKDLQAFINQVQPKTTAQHVYHDIEPEARNCPVCDNKLVVRESSTNKFFGCSSYPVCSHTEPINDN